MVVPRIWYRRPVQPLALRITRVGRTVYYDAGTIHLKVDHSIRKAFERLGYAACASPSCEVHRYVPILTSRDRAARMLWRARGTIIGYKRSDHPAATPTPERRSRRHNT